MKKKNYLLAALSVGLLAGPMAAQAQYDFELIDHPGSPDTQVFGINDRGNVVGNGFNNVDGFPFVYDSKKGTYTNVAPFAGFDDTSVLGIDDAGNMVGSVANLDDDGNVLTASGFIRDKKGNFTVFSHPDTTTSTNPRAINNKGIVSGFAETGVPFPFTTVGFTYDPKTDTFTDFIPTSVFTIAHGINSKGDSVGNSFFLAADDPCGDGPDFVVYSWLRTADGNVTYFTVNGESTRARGINDSGKIAGFIFDDGPARGFVVELDGSQCQEITVDASDLLVNDLGFEDTIPEGITNSGDVVGNIGDEFSSHGFIARKK